MGARKVTPDELREVLNRHKQWIDTDEEEGERADLREADLQGANLQGADLREADLREAYLQEADLQGADLREAYLREAYLQGADLREADLREAYLREADLRRAYLQGANLRRAYLQGANLQGADLDYSVLPLWCGGLRMKADRRLMAQIAYHFCAQECNDPGYLAARNAVLVFANTFHRAKACGVLERIEPEKVREEDAAE